MRTVLAVFACVTFFATAHANTAEQNTAFTQGANLNRTGDFVGAYRQLKALESDGYRNPELDFEIGWSLLGMRRAGACVPRLQRYKQAVPGRAIASEILGRCHLLLRDYDKAEAEFRAALALDPKAQPRVDLYLAQVQSGRGDKQAVQAFINDALRDESNIGRALRDGQAALTALAPAPGTGLKLTASAALGYNSNVIALGNTQPLPGDISGKSSAFLRTGFGVSNSAQLDAQTRGSIGYGLLLDRYMDIRAANTDDHYAYADVSRRMSERLALSLRASLQLTYLDGEHFRTQPAIRAGAAYKFTPNSTTEGAYSFATANYKASTTPAFNRDGDIHSLSIAHQIRMPESPWSGAFGYNHVENRTDGADFRSSGDTISGILRYSFGRRIELSAGGTYGRDRYDNANSLSAAGLARRDNPSSAFVQLSGAFTDAVRYYVQLLSSRSGSNISFYDYRQQSLIGGVSVEF